MKFFYDSNITLEKYVKLGTENEFPVLEKCPCCGGIVKLYRHGFFWRYAIEEEVQYRIPICRLRCPSCKKTVSLLPDFLVPHFQYTLNAVLNKIKVFLINHVIAGVRQLVAFYCTRFKSQSNQVEMFFRDQGLRVPLPQGCNEKAKDLLKRILDWGSTKFLRSSIKYFKPALWQIN